MTFIQLRISPLNQNLLNCSDGWSLSSWDLTVVAFIFIPLPSSLHTGHALTTELFIYQLVYIIGDWAGGSQSLNQLCNDYSRAKILDGSVKTVRVVWKPMDGSSQWYPTKTPHFHLVFCILIGYINGTHQAHYRWILTANSL